MSLTAFISRGKTVELFIYSHTYAMITDIQNECWIIFVHMLGITLNSTNLYFYVHQKDE
jgi:hypothetical protein